MRPVLHACGSSHVLTWCLTFRFPGPEGAEERLPGHQAEQSSIQKRAGGEEHPAHADGWGETGVEAADRHQTHKVRQVARDTFLNLEYINWHATFMVPPMFSINLLDDAVANLTATAEETTPLGQNRASWLTLGRRWPNILADRDCDSIQSRKQIWAFFFSLSKHFYILSFLPSQHANRLNAISC